MNLRLFIQYLLQAVSIFIISTNCYSQSTVITPGGAQPSINATSTKNGVVFPRMTTNQKNAISSLSAGTIVYDLDLNCLSLYTGSGWVCVNSPSSSLGPVFQNFQLNMNPSGNAPLSGTISIQSNQPFKLSYIVKGQDGEDFLYTNDKFSSGTDTTINLFALYPSFTNTVIVSIINQAGYLSQRTVYIPTDPIPAGMPQPNEITVNSRTSNIITKFILCFPNKTQGLQRLNDDYYTMAIDTYGKIRFYLTGSSYRGALLKPIQNGNWLAQLAQSFVEIDLLGNIVRTIPIQYTSHHDFTQLTNGNIIYLGESSLNNTIEDKIYTIDFNTGVAIDSINIYNILDPLRTQLPAGPNNDWLHCNSITYDETDNSIIVSGRQQSAVFKINLGTKQLKWILSDSTGWNNLLSPYLLTPTGTNFEQQWGQHAAILKPSDNHTMLLFDNGNSRSYTNPIPPSSNYSRLVEYSFDETNKTVIQNFEFGKTYGSALFAPYISGGQYLNNDRFLINFGGILKDINNNAIENTSPNGINQFRIFEADRNQNVYFDISIKNPIVNNSQLIGFRSYRAYNFNFK